MPAGLVLRFDGQTLADYDRVNGLLEIDQKQNSGDWPPGITARPTVTWVDLASFNLPQGAAAG